MKKNCKLFSSSLLKSLGVTILLIIPMTLSLVGCSQAERASYNLSRQADNFNVVREITVINCLQGDTLFQMSGRMSIELDEAENQLEIMVENENGTYVKHFIGLSDNVTYVIEDLNLGDNEVNNYRYTLNFNPKMWIPVDFETIE